MKNNSQTDFDKKQLKITIPEEWQDWVDHNLARKVSKEHLINQMIEKGNFLRSESEKFVTDAVKDCEIYANFVTKILPDFNDEKQNELNLSHLRQFLDEERKFLSNEKIIKMLEWHWLELDPSCKNFEVRARKIAFFHAMDYLILAYGYDFPYPDPFRFCFFPVIDFNGNGVCDKLQSPDIKGLESSQLFALAEISNKVLYLIKNKKGELINLGDGMHGKVCRGFYDEDVAVKFLPIGQMKSADFGLKWQEILIYYRQSKIVLEQFYDNVLPMKEVFFFHEKSVFSANQSHVNLVAIYPLCQKSLYDILEEKSVIFSDYADLSWIKKLLQTIANLHQNNITIHDLVTQNIMFDFAGDVFFHDFDYWLPLRFESLKSVYSQKNIIGSGYASLSELDFLLDNDLQKIVPQKIDIWCFAMLILAALGHLYKIESLRARSVEMLIKSTQKKSNSDIRFIDEIALIKRDTADFVVVALQKILKQRDDAKNLSQREFFSDLHEVLDVCLMHDPNQRWNAKQLLQCNLFQKIN